MACAVLAAAGMAAQAVGPAYAASGRVTTAVDNGVTLVTPTRVLDTSVGRGANGPIPVHGAVTVQVEGVAGVPASNVYAVVLTVTVTRPTSPGYLSVYPDWATPGGTSSMNFAVGQSVASTVITPVNPNGRAVFYNGSSGTIQLAVDITGYTASVVGLAGPGGLENGAHNRILDTRTGLGAAGPVAGHGTLHLNVAGLYPMAAVSMVLLTLTATGARAPGYLTAYPDGTARPATSNLNFAAGQRVADTVLVPLGPDGLLDLYNGSTAPVQMIVDMSAYVPFGTVTGSGGLIPLTPTRLLDTGTSVGSPGPVAGHGSIHLVVLGHGGVPASGVRAVIMTLTVTHPSAAGFVSAAAGGGPASTTPAVVFAAGQTTANLVIVPVGPDGSVLLSNASAGPTQLIADVTGYITSG